MDVDSDFDQNLLQQFSCMGTTDREVLISQLQKLIGNQLNADGCAFFLDMNNWNLQAAACSYFDCESPKEKLPCMTFVKDVTIGEGESVPPNTKFVKTWRVVNSGEESWPPGCILKFTLGDRLGPQEKIPIGVLAPGEMADLSVEMISPEKTGIYQGQWRMCTSIGKFFGEVIWVIVTVAEGGLLGLTQQMSQFNQLGSPPRMTAFVPSNPFAFNHVKRGEIIDSNTVRSSDGVDPSAIEVSDVRQDENCTDSPVPAIFKLCDDKYLE